MLGASRSCLVIRYEREKWDNRETANWKMPSDTESGHPDAQTLTSDRRGMHVLGLDGTYHLNF